jgi:flagellar hook-associated protein 3 FlgL
MRISSGMMFDAGATGITRQTAALLKVQQQLASGRRVLTPGDDPVAASRALDVSQANDVVTQFAGNQVAANAALGLEDVKLEYAGELLQRVNELAIQAGGVAGNAAGRKAVATELRGIYDQLLGIANTKDEAGNYMFGGYMSNTVPFGGSIDSLIAGGEIVYQGDEGQRRLQVSSGRQIAISDSGLDIFRRIPNGNGYFTTGYAAGNTGTAAIGAGSVNDPAAWSASPAKNVDVRFTVAAGVTTYDLVDTATGKSLLTGVAPPTAVGNQRSYTNGQLINFKSQGAEPAFDLGGSVAISGNPANGDSFNIAPATTQSVFATVAKLIGALESGGMTPAALTKYSSDIGAAFTGNAQALNHIVGARSRVGTRMNEIEAAQTMSGDLSLQYQQTLSELQDVDFATAVTELTRRQAGLEAAQRSFLRISQLSLFNSL